MQTVQTLFFFHSTTKKTTNQNPTKKEKTNEEKQNVEVKSQIIHFLFSSQVSTVDVYHRQVKLWHFVGIVENVGRQCTKSSGAKVVQLFELSKGLVCTWERVREWEKEKRAGLCDGAHTREPQHAEGLKILENWSRGGHKQCIHFNLQPLLFALLVSFLNEKQKARAFTSNIRLNQWHTQQAGTSPT